LSKLNDAPATVTMLRKRGAAALRRLKERGWVREVPQEGDYKGWVRT
jgi:hypothetical protein